MDKPVLPHITTGKPQRADGTKDNTPPTASCLSPSMRTWESLQGMRRTVEVGRGDSYRKVQGPAGSQIGHSSRSVGKPHTWRRPLGIGSVTANYSGNAQAVTPRTRWNPDEINVIVNCPLYREPCAVKVARTVLTGGLGKRTLGQRALILPTAFSTDRVRPLHATLLPLVPAPGVGPHPSRRPPWRASHQSVPEAPRATGRHPAPQGTDRTGGWERAAGAAGAAWRGLIQTR